MVRNFSKQTGQKIKFLFQASLTSIHASTAEIDSAQKFEQNVEGQTAFQLYIVDLSSSQLKQNNFARL